MNFQPQQSPEVQQPTEEISPAATPVFTSETPELTQARQTIARSSAPAELAAEPNAAAAPQPANAYDVQPTAGNEQTLAQVAPSVIMALEVAAEQKQKVNAMMTLLLEETVRARRAKIWRRVRITGFLVFIVWLLWASGWHAVGNWWFYYTVGSGIWAADRNWGKRHRVVNDLREADDPRAVGVLAIAARDGTRAVAQIAQRTLLALLPRVRADHAAGITPDQMNALLELAFRSNPAMQLAVLKALEQIGDQRAIPVVENLSLSPDPVLKEQAKQCLPFLIARALRAEQSATLLRGTASPGMSAAPSELLRPAVGTTDATPAAELLRAVEPFPPDKSV